MILSWTKWNFACIYILIYVNIPSQEYYNGYNSVENFEKNMYANRLSPIITLNMNWRI